MIYCFSFRDHYIQNNINKTIKSRRVEQLSTVETMNKLSIVVTYRIEMREN